MVLRSDAVIPNIHIETDVHSTHTARTDMNLTKQLFIYETIMQGMTADVTVTIRIGSITALIYCATDS